MARKATRKTRTTSRKKVSLKKRASTRTVAAKKRAPARRKTAARRGVAVGETSAAREIEKLLDDTQAKLVATWEKEANAASKTFEALRKKLERAAERQRKLKDRRVVAVSRHKARRNETTLAAREKAKQAYTVATEVVVELRGQVDAARARMKAAKLGLARALARDKALARFAKDYGKTRARKVKAPQRRTRKRPRRPAGQPEEATTAAILSGPEAQESGGDATAPEVE